jgi:hypothetical protein
MGASTDAAPADRHARGVAAYARIFQVPEDQVAAAFAARVGPVFAEEQLARLSGGWVMCRRAAARPKWRSSATATK